MGNASPIGAGEQEQIEQLMKGIIETFVKEFADAVPPAIVKVAKKKNPRGKEELPLLLKGAPTPSEPIHSGRLIKSGPNGDSWRERFFLFYNKKDNFKIEYYDGDDEKSGKHKGTIYCEGYDVRDFDKDDKEKFGGEGFKLVPYWYADRRRQWNFKWLADTTDDQKKKFKGAFESACRGSKPPSEVDEVTRIAFQKALEATRWENGIWGYYCWFGVETDRVIEFIYNVVEQKVLRAAFDKFEAPAFARDRAINAAKSAVRNGITSACKASISSALAASQPVMKQIQEVCDQGMDPIFEAEHKLRTDIVALVTDTAKPALELLGGKMQPLLEKMFGEITRGFSAAISGWNRIMTERCQEEHKDFDAFDKDAIKYTESWLGYWWSRNVLNDAYEELYKMRDESNPLFKYRDSLPNSFSFYDMYWTARERLEQTTRSALHNLRAAKPNTMEERLSALRDVTAKYVHDLKVVERDLLIRLLVKIVEDPIDENVIRPAQALCKPIVDVIKALPQPIQPLFDIKTLVRDVVEGIVKSFMSALVDQSVVQNVYEPIDKAGLAIGIDVTPI